MQRFTNVKQLNDHCNPLSYHAIEYSEKMRRYYKQYDEVLGTLFYGYMYMFGSKLNGNLQFFLMAIFFPKKKINNN